jgi:hypothetical protein
LKIRPEAFSMQVEKSKKYGNRYNIEDELLDSKILDKVYNKYGNYILNQCFPEGSPCHPAYPSGHAVYIGACITLLKAFYDENYYIDSFLPNKDGSELIKLNYKLKVGDELNKLASNIANFRNAAGIHYRDDGEGIKLGEQISIELLEDHVNTYPFDVKFSFHKINGEMVVIKNYV